ncbi:MAG TPA: hypothetical protein VGM82_24355 [Gemmatimonadaceae bacterium]
MVESIEKRAEVFIPPQASFYRRSGRSLEAHGASYATDGTTLRRSHSFAAPSPRMQVLSHPFDADAATMQSLVPETTRTHCLTDSRSFSSDSGAPAIEATIDESPTVAPSFNRSFSTINIVALSFNALLSGLRRAPRAFRHIDAAFYAWAYGSHSRRAIAIGRRSLLQTVRELQLAVLRLRQTLRALQLFVPRLRQTLR